MSAAEGFDVEDFDFPPSSGPNANDDDFFESASSTQAPRVGLSPTDIINRWKAQGPIERLATGWPTFDRESRGGFIFGHCTYLLGAPNAKKTAALACLADAWVRDDVYVGGLIVDEDASDFLIRFAVRAGFSLDDCERRDPDVLAKIETVVRDLPIRLYDSTWNIEAAAADFQAFVGERRRAAFMLDTVQTVMSAAAARADSPRALVSANVKAAHALALSTRWAWIATSEMNRNAYRSEDAAERTNDMAAGKESGAIEYAAKAQLVFRSVKGDGGLVHVRAPKIKRGASDETEFHLRFDRRDHSMVECASPAADGNTDHGKKRSTIARQVRDDAKTLLGVILRHQGIGERELRAELRREGHGWGVDRLDAAKRALGDRLENRGANPRQSRWHVVAAPQEGDADAAQ